MKKIPEVTDENRGNVIEKAPTEPVAHIKWLVSILKGLGVSPYIILAAVLPAVVLQTWETPREKVKDEWRACNLEFSDQCEYVGVRFETGYVELYVSEAIHGTPRATTYKKLRGTYKETK